MMSQILFFLSTSSLVSPLNREQPVSKLKNTAPKLKMSLLSEYPRPLKISGAV